MQIIAATMGNKSDIFVINLIFPYTTIMFSFRFVEIMSPGKSIPSKVVSL